MSLERPQGGPGLWSRPHSRPRPGSGPMPRNCYCGWWSALQPFKLWSWEVFHVMTKCLWCDVKGRKQNKMCTIIVHPHKTYSGAKLGEVLEMAWGWWIMGNCSLLFYTSNFYVKIMCSFIRTLLRYTYSKMYVLRWIFQWKTSWTFIHLHCCGTTFWVRV